MKLTERFLLDILAERAPRALHASEIATRAKLTRDAVPSLLRLLERLRDRGQVVEMPGHRFRLVPPSEVPRNATRGRDAGPSPAPARARTRDDAAASRPASPARGQRLSTAREHRPSPTADDEPRRDGAMVRGVLDLHPRGFAFVLPDDGGIEVFVQREQMGPALHGDRVEVMAYPSARGREGRVTGIIQRRRAKLVGTLHGETARHQVFAPGDARLPETMRIVPPLPPDVAVGDAVIAEIVGYPQTPDDVPLVAIRGRLGLPGDLEVEVARVLARDGVVEDFPEEVRAEAKRIPKKVSEEEALGRRDLRDLALVTVDPDDARDHDDALFAERLPTGGYRIVVAIADVAHYVRPGTAIDTEALARATSIYLPSRAIPMLPREISSKIASLLPGEDRLCMGVEVELSEAGLVQKRSFFEGVMRSRARITYGGAARALGLTTIPRAQREAEEHRDALKVLLEASKTLRTRRARRGSLDFDLPEARIVFGDGGSPVDVVESRGDPGVREAYRMVEELMLLANELVAEHLTSLGLPALHRIHPPPDAKRLETFAELARSLGHDVDVEDLARPKPLARFLASVEDSKEAPFLRYLLLRAMQQASYSLDSNIGHFGLAARHYLHFTSPIRRYPDLAVHRVLRMHLRGERIDLASLMPKLRMQAVESSRLERRLMTVDRDVKRVHEIAVMREHVGEVLVGKVAFVEKEVLTVRLDAPFVDVSVDVTRIPGRSYELDRLGLALVSRSGHRIGVGDRIAVRILDASMTTRRILAAPEVAEGQTDTDGALPRASRRESSRHDGSLRPRVHPKEARRGTRSRS